MKGASLSSNKDPYLMIVGIKTSRIAYSKVSKNVIPIFLSNYYIPLSNLTKKLLNN